MKSAGPWNLRGLHPEARAAARAAARRSGMSVGEWLNTVIQPADEDDESWWSSDFDREPDDRWGQRPRYGERERFRNAPPPWRERDHYREAPPPRQERDRYRDAPPPWQEGDRYRDAPPPRQERDRYREAPPPRQECDRNRDAPPSRHRGRVEEDGDDRPARRRNRPYGEDNRPSGRPYRTGQERPDHSIRERPPHDEGAPNRRVQDAREASIDHAVAEIEARQRALDVDPSAEIRARQRALDADPAAEMETNQPALDADLPAQQRAVETDAAEIRARQRALDDDTAPARSFSEREPQPFPSRPEPSYAEQYSREAPLDLSGLEHQIRQMTARIETLQPTGDLQMAIQDLRNDLAEISCSLTEALPRRALESLEIEVKALAQRIDHTRQSGADVTELAGVERGLAEVREALRELTPAESLIGFNEAVQTLAKRVDAIIARDDPATLQQLETAIGALRGIVSHVASNDTLTKVAEDVRALAGKVDGLANSATNLPALTAIENRIDVLTGAINASTEAGHAVPRELEKLLSGLIEKLEWVQLTHTDHTALAHLEDRIASLVKRLDVSDARLGLLEGVERGLADLLVYIEQLRGGGTPSPVAAASPVVPSAIVQEVAEIKQIERRTRDSLEDVQGTVEHVVDRLAMIESDMWGDNAPAGSAGPISEPVPVPSSEPVQELPISLVAPAHLEDEVPVADAASAPQPETQISPAPRQTKARMPIDPSLPPDHPLEPGSAIGRTRDGSSAADRIAASEAAVGSKPPVIPDPGGGKPDFIAAARRAAKAAAVTAPEEKASAKNAAGGAAPAKKLSERLRTLAVASAVVIIIVGGFHIVSRLFEDGGASAPPQTRTEPPRVLSEPPRLQAEPKPLPPIPPQVQTEPASPPAAAVPVESPAPAPAVIQVPPAAVDSTQGPAAPPPSTTPGPQTNASPGQQSSLGSPSGDKTHRLTTVAATPIGPPTDITGSLPKSSGPRTGNSLARMGGDKLPVAIGGPVLRNAALAGDPYAAYEVAVRFADGRLLPANDEEAAHWFEIAAKKGLAPAQFRLGALYEKGLGVHKDLAAARDLYRVAADKGHGKAMHNLAVLYAEGIDGKTDYRAAAQWFRKAADRGITDSQYNLAVLYARGVGVEQSFADSYKWFFLAAKDGDSDAAQKRDEVATHLDRKALEAARLAAKDWKPLPQPADAITVKGAWDVPANGTPPAKPKARSNVKTSAAPDAAKTN